MHLRLMPSMQQQLLLLLTMLTLLPLLLLDPLLKAAALTRILDQRLCALVCESFICTTDVSPSQC